MSTRKKKPTGKQNKRQGRDQDGLGLFLITVVLFFAVMFLPQFPSGQLGESVRAFTTGQIGVAAMLVLPPVLLIAALLMMRKSAPWLGRVLTGYFLTLAGVWLGAVVLVPSMTGAIGAELHHVLQGAWGALALFPAAIIISIGFDYFANVPPTTLFARGMRGLFAAVVAFWRWLLRLRRNALERADFSADVALTRRALNDIDRDLAALTMLYPLSKELERWRSDVESLRRELRRVDRDGLGVVNEEIQTWEDAITSFTAERAAELTTTFANERVSITGQQQITVGEWSRGLLTDAEIDIPGTNAVANDLRALVAALGLDITGFTERYDRLSAERDADQRALLTMTAPQLAKAYKAHQRRVAELTKLSEQTASLEHRTEVLTAWSAFAEQLHECVERYEGFTELQEYVETLQRELTQDRSETLQQVSGWQKALFSVAKRAEAARQAALAQAASDTETVDAHEGTEPDEPAPEVPAPAPDTQPDAVATTEVTADDTGDVFSQFSDIEVPDEPLLPETNPLLTSNSAIDIQVPPFELLDPMPGEQFDRAEIQQENETRVNLIDETLESFRVNGRVVESVRGPSVTRFEVEPAPGEKISRFANLSDDLALAMAVGSVRIEAPIPGKSVIGLEVPNQYRELVPFREAVESRTFRRAKARLPIILGRAIEGEMMIGDLARMPHLLIAGSTGSGKSVAVNTLISSLLFRFLPSELRFLMIDPKMVELTPYDGIPHLLLPVVTNPSESAGVLLGAVAHMERRYQMMSKIGAKNLDQYNEKARNLDLPELPFIVIIIDELADLMITSPKEVESAIMRLAQMARATGMHLILATQRPSVDILTSLIKVNVPARMAFAVSSGHDSRTILDTMGAERLIGTGDMLFYQPGLTKAVRLQGPFISENEIQHVADFLRRQVYDDEFVEAYGADFEPKEEGPGPGGGMIDWNDDKLRPAAELVVSEGQASVSRLQRRLSVGHARAGKLMDSLEALGIVGPHQGSKPRDVLITMDELPNVLG